MSDQITASTTEETIFGIPFNRVVTFLGPHISWVAGVIATWLIVHVHVLGLAHVQQDGLTTAIAQGVTFVVVTLVTWLGHQQWLKGHHIALAGEADATAAFITNQSPMPPAPEGGVIFTSSTTAPPEEPPQPNIERS